MFILSILILMYQTSLISAVCNYFYESGVPVPLDTCSWTTATYSFGYYCYDNYNGTDKTAVLLMQFDSKDCKTTDSEGDIYYVYDCEEYGDDCNCDGDPDHCTIATTKTEDLVVSDCNSTSYIEKKEVWDVCIGRNSLG
eukprot:127648_1